MSFRRVLRSLVLPLAAVLLLANTQAPQSSPRSTIERFNTTLLSVMQNASNLKFAGRFQKLEPVLKESFDLPYMAQFSAGSQWQHLSEVERGKLVELFSRLWISTYADRFNDYSGESFEIVTAEEAPQGTKLVRTNIVKRSGKKVALDYLMRQKDNNWAVVDIFLKGKYSELAKQRSEYTSVLKREGLNGLVAKVREKVKLMEANDQ